MNDTAPTLTTEAYAVTEKSIKNLKPFKPGQSGNPGGRPKVPPDLKKARELNKNAIAKIILDQLNMTISELTKISKATDKPAMEVLAATLVVFARKYGDFSRINFLLDRSIGKVTETIKHQLPTPTLVKLTDGDAYLLGAEDNEQGE